MSDNEQVRQWLLEDLEKLINSNLVFGHRKKTERLPFKWAHQGPTVCTEYADCPGCVLSPSGHDEYKPTDVVLNLHMVERLTAAAMAAHVLGNYDWPTITGGPLADQLKKETVFEWPLPDRLDGLAWKAAATAAFEAWAKALKPGDTKTRFRLQLVREK